MDKGEISRRYATAIYSISKSLDRIGEIREVLNILSENYEGDEEFKRFLSDPSVKFEEKEKFIEKSFKFTGSRECDIVKYIVKKGRFPLVQGIKEEFLKIYYEENGKLPVIAEFAKELSEVQKEKLIGKLEKKYKKKIVLKLITNDSLIGGGVLKIGNEIIDGSIKSQIENIKKIF